MDVAPLEIPARDGYSLGATIHRADAPRGSVVVSGATAVPHRFYGPFASALASAGLTTITYDYRGVAASKHGSLRGFPATLNDWALQDMAGVVDWALAELGVERIGLVGHSFG